MTIEPILAAAIAFSVSQVLLGVLLLSRKQFRWTQVEYILFLYLLAAIAYLLYPLTEDHWTRAPTSLIQTLLPGMFWLFCGRLFDDQFELTTWKLSLVAATVLLPATGMLLDVVNSSLDTHSPVSYSPISYLLRSPPRWLVYTLPQALEFIALVLALKAVTQYWRDDLIQARRNMRFWFCLMTGLFSITLIFMREILFPGAAWLELWQYIPVGVICLVTNLMLLEYKPDLIGNIVSTNQTENALNEKEADNAEVPQGFKEELAELMNQQFLYREVGLTIGKLAKTMKLPEYKLRKIINTGLGHRNFSDFLNSYRVRDAGKRLSSPDYAKHTILNIALDTGFKTLSSFNKAFKATYQQTPTAFRNKHLAG